MPAHAFHGSAALEPSPAHYFLLRHASPSLSPLSQMNMLLSFRADQERDDCPCPEEIQDLLHDFHHRLTTHCGKPHTHRSGFGLFCFVQFSSVLVLFLCPEWAVWSQTESRPTHNRHNILCILCFCTDSQLLVC